MNIIQKVFEEGVVQKGKKNFNQEEKTAKLKTVTCVSFSSPRW